MMIPGLSLRSNPWAEISERLRRIVYKFNPTHHTSFLLTLTLTIHPWYSPRADSYLNYCSLILLESYQSAHCVSFGDRPIIFDKR